MKYLIIDGEKVRNLTVEDALLFLLDNYKEKSIRHDNGRTMGQVISTDIEPKEIKIRNKAFYALSNGQLVYRRGNNGPWRRRRPRNPDDIVSKWVYPDETGDILIKDIRKLL